MRVFLLVCILLGSFLGAGFASGKEIVTYFTVFGIDSNISIVLATIILFFVMVFYFSVSSKVAGFSGVIRLFFGKFSSVISALFVLCIFILVSTMFAGASSIASAIDVVSWAILIPTSIIVFICNYFSLKGISRINAVVIPFMLMVILMVYGVGDISFENGFSIMSSVSAINYVFINMLMMGILIIEIGKGYSKREWFFASMLFSICIGVLLLIANNSLFVVGDLSIDMPILYLAKEKGCVLYICTIISIWLALLTSIISNVFVLETYFDKVIKNRSIRLMLIIAISVIVSMLGFDIMVGYLYSFIGAVGLLFMIVLIKKQRNIKYSSV
ncbi:MAG: hypothetical protein E7354_02705 [Clostridiales bacterium]|nr:hypothetical protein [Clostridiales bacterium]